MMEDRGLLEARGGGTRDRNSRMARYGAGVMEIQPMAVPHAFRILARKLPDARGCFYESFKRDELAVAVGHSFSLAQVNYSISRRGTLRGIHGVTIPPGQAKVVTCVRGTVLDLVLDIRTGSPAFGRHDTTLLEAESGSSVYVAEGLGHGFLALTDDACVGYLCSTQYVPGTPFELNPLDPDLCLPWNVRTEPLMSAKDASAPKLADAARAGLLPTWKQCLQLYAALRAKG
jgi:dTDP-4-dehydrorhamnose 3,5-epimerase